MPTFDVAVIGAGINGCAAAWFLARSGLKVALFDREGIASGGSGAAGAFISPKISKSGPLKQIMDDAYAFSLAFYATEFSASFTPAPQLHIAKFDDENAKVTHFREHTPMHVGDAPDAYRSLLTDEAREFASVFFQHSGIVDAEAACRAMAEAATLFCEEVQTLERSSGLWRVGSIQAKRVVLATGAYEPVMPEPYIALRAVWGHRIDIRTSERVEGIIHHRVSLAPTDAAGRSAVGATHDLKYHPQRSAAPYDVEAGRKELLEKVRSTVRLGEIEILRDYTGLRSGSNDYLPMLGRLVDSEATLAAHPELRKGARVAPEAYCYHEGLYMINGSGGYGFVLAPYLAAQLERHIGRGEPIDPRIEPSRFFGRWAKKGVS